MNGRRCQYPFPSSDDSKVVDIRCLYTHFKNLVLSFVSFFSEKLRPTSCLKVCETPELTGRMVGLVPTETSNGSSFTSNSQSTEISAFGRNSEIQKLTLTV